jgi:hypothetical protein
MNIEEFIKDQMEMLKEFQQEWELGKERNPEHYPEELDAGEWDEQLRAFMGW